MEKTNAMDPNTQNPNNTTEPNYASPQAPQTPPQALVYQTPPQAPVYQSPTTIPVAGYPPPPQNSNKKTIWIIVAILGGLFLICAIVIAILLIAAYNNHKPVALSESTNDDTSSRITNYNYDDNQVANGFDGELFKDLVPATAEYFKYITGINSDSRENKTISVRGTKVDGQLFDRNGQPDKNGRYGLFSPAGSTFMCMSDYQNKVSYMIVFDPPGGDGNTALIALYNKTNCYRDETMGFSNKGDVIITKNSVRSNIEGGASREVSGAVEYFRDLIATSPMLVNIRAHFIGSYADSLSDQ